MNEGDVFCQSCGKRVDESPSTEMSDLTQNNCPNCGALVNDGDVFCQSCGNPLNEVPTPHPTRSYDEAETPTDYKKIIIPL